MSTSAGGRCFVLFLYSLPTKLSAALESSRLRSSTLWARRKLRKTCWCTRFFKCVHALRMVFGFIWRLYLPKQLQHNSNSVVHCNGNSTYQSRIQAHACIPRLYMSATLSSTPQQAKWETRCNVLCQTICHTRVNISVQFIVIRKLMSSAMRAHALQTPRVLCAQRLGLESQWAMLLMLQSGRQTRRKLERRATPLFLIWLVLPGGLRGVFQPMRNCASLYRWQCIRRSSTAEISWVEYLYNFLT